MTDTKKRILARRAKFVAAALAATGVGACASVDEEPSTKVDTGVAGDSSVKDTGTPEPCLGISADSGEMLDTATDTAPMPCLDPAPDDTGVADTADVDAGPAPCLKMPPPDAG